MSVVVEPDDGVHRGIEDVWRAHGRPLRQLCAVLVGPDDADDVAVEVVVRCWKRVVSGEVERERAYLFRAAVNTAHNLRRARRRERARIPAGPSSASVVSDGRVEESIRVREAIVRLSARQRAVLYLAYWQDQTEAEIAETLGVHVGTVRRHLVRARQHLRRTLQ